MGKYLALALLTTGLAFPIPTSATELPIEQASSAAQVASLSAESFVPVSPVRVLDTRSGLGANERPLASGETVRLQLAGVRGIPDDIVGVIINVTSIQSSEASFITVWPAGQDQPGTSNLNTEPGQNTPNLVAVGVSSNGAVDVFNSSGTVHLAADVTAYLTSAADVTPLPPDRVLDSRDATGTTAAPFGPGETRRIQVGGQSGVPANAAAVILNVTSTRSTDQSFITVWPGGSTRPEASTLNTEPGQDTPNLAIVALGANGTIDVYNDKGTTHFVADVMGFVSTASNITVGTPARFLDTRRGTGTSGATSPVGPDQSIDLQVAGTQGVPANATAVIVNLTSTQATQPSFVTTWPTGESRPTASTLNTEVGQSTPNLAVVKVGSGGKISLYNQRGSTHLIVDVAGWFVPASAQPFVDDLSFFRAAGSRTTSDFGLTRKSSFGWNVATRTFTASAAAGPFATGEDFSARARLFTSFQAERTDAELTFDIEWNGTLTAFVGAAAATEVSVIIRVYEVVTSSSGSVTRGEEVWDEVLEDTGIGSGLQVIAVDQVSGSKIARRQLPDLAVGTNYRVEAELVCNTRVTFSIGATACDFGTGARGVTVNDWSLEYAPVE